MALEVQCVAHGRVAVKRVAVRSARQLWQFVGAVCRGVSNSSKHWQIEAVLAVSSVS